MLRFHYVFSGEAASKKNSKRLVRVGRRMVLLPSKQYQTWERKAKAAVFAYGRPAAPLKAARLFIKIFHGDMLHRDSNNATQGVQDLLVETGVIEDDNWMAIGAPEVSHFIDVSNPRMEVLVQEAEPVDYPALFKTARKEAKGKRVLKKTI